MNGSERPTGTRRAARAGPGSGVPEHDADRGALEGQLAAAPILFLLGAIILLVLTCLPVPGEAREAHNGLAVAREAFGHARWLQAHAPELTHSEMAVH